MILFISQKAITIQKKRCIYSFMNRHKIPIYVSLRNTKKKILHRAILISWIPYVIMNKDQLKVSNNVTNKINCKIAFRCYQLLC